MQPYLFVFLVSAALLPFDRMKTTPPARLALLGMPFVLLVLLTGTRVATGNDWQAYYDYYADLSALGDKSEDFEVGYRSFAYAAKLTGLGNEGFLFLSSVVYLSAFFWVFRNQRGAMAIVLLFYCTYLLGWMGTARQVMAIALTVMAGQSLVAGHKGRFLTLVLLAASFHQTALLFFFAWFLRGRPWKLATYVLIPVACIVGGQLLKLVLPPVLDRIAGVEGVGEKVLFYGNIGADELGHASGALLGTLWYAKRLVFLALFLYLRQHFASKALTFYLNAYVVSVAIFLILDPVLPILATRGANYFSIYELFLLASLVTTRARLSALAIPFILVLAGQRLYTSLYAYHPDLYLPYKGLFINEEIRREVY